MTAVLLHGIGLGGWFWDPWLPLFAEAGFATMAPTLAGHQGGDAALDDVVAQVEAVLDGLDGPVALVGHSMGGLVAQVVASRRPLHALALVCALPPGQVGLRFAPRVARWIPGLLPSLLRHRPVAFGWDAWRSAGLCEMPEARAREVYARVVPWPNRLTRDVLTRRPRVEGIASPVLVCIGRRDGLVPWEQARLVGDLYEGIVWRYDDLGHLPPWEDGGERMGRDLVAWCASPSRPQVIESEGFGPAEGVGWATRRERRGEQMKRRSAYGQKGSAR